jgi:hypothetical protein
MKPLAAVVHTAGFGINRQSANQVLVDTQFVDGTPQVFLADSLLVKASVEIRVYPA